MHVSVAADLLERWIDLQLVQSVPGNRRLQRFDRHPMRVEQDAVEFRVARELAQDFAGQQQAFLVQEDVALVHCALLVLQLEDDGAGGAGFAINGPHACGKNNCRRCAAPEGAQFAPWDGPAVLMSRVMALTADARRSARRRGG